MIPHRFPARGLSTLAAACLFPVLAAAQSVKSDSPHTPVDLKKLSIEQLMEIEVTLVTRQPEKLYQAPSGIQVITADDIRRSGVSTLPEALRLASNLIVAQVNAKDFAISARGFNQALANKLLVMIDGRTVYTPLYAGVFWDVQHVILENIDRIEVVSGPGGTLWGANAVNGVINIVTKHAKDTRGALVEAWGGTFLQDQVVARYGGEAAPGLHWRVYGHRLDHGPTRFDGSEEHNDWAFTRGGTRADLKRGKDHVTVQAEAAAGGFGQSPLRPAGRPESPQDDVETNSQVLQVRWERENSTESGFQAKIYAVRDYRLIPRTFEEDLRTYDLDFQQHIQLGGLHEFTFGGGMRYMQDDVSNLGPGLAFLPEDRDLRLFSGFLQDQLGFLDDRLKLTAGMKVEHNDYSGLELMPSGRAGWSPTVAHTYWAAVSRAVRSPSRIDVEFHLPAPPPTAGFPHLDGSPDFGSEKLIAYELGWRARPREKYSLSVTGFLHRYDDLRLVELDASAPPGDSLLELTNGIRGDLWGVEFAGDCRAFPWWRLRSGYSFSYAWLETKEGHAPYAQSGREGNDPGYQAFLQSYMDLPRGFQLNAVFRAIDELPRPLVPRYLGLDLGVSWLGRNWEAGVYGRNLLEERHAEFGAERSRQEIPRSLMGRVAWRL